MTLMSLEEFRQGIDIPVEDMDELEALLAEVTELWEATTSRPWVQDAASVHIWSPDNDRNHDAWLPLLPVTSITSIEERYADETTWTTLDATSYLIVDGTVGHVQKVSSCWQPHVRFTYAGGYTASTTPEVVKRALIVQANFSRQRLSRDNVIFRSKSTRAGSTDFLERADLHPFFARTARRFGRR